MRTAHYFIAPHSVTVTLDLLKSNHFGLYVTLVALTWKECETSPWQCSVNGTGIRI